MSFRFRVGPVTVGKTGVRLSPWKKHGGVSIPLTKRLDDYVTKEKEDRRPAPGARGVARVGPFRWHMSLGKWWKEFWAGFFDDTR